MGLPQIKEAQEVSRLQSNLKYTSQQCQKYASPPRVESRGRDFYATKVAAVTFPVTFFDGGGFHHDRFERHLFSCHILVVGFLRVGLHTDTYVRTVEEKLGEARILWFFGTQNWASEALNHSRVGLGMS